MLAGPRPHTHGQVPQGPYNAANWAIGLQNGCQSSWRQNVRPCCEVWHTADCLGHPTGPRFRGE